LRLGERRLLVIIVTPDADVQNRVIHTAVDYSQSQLIEASNYLNAQFAGLSLDDVRHRLRGEIDDVRAEIVSLMNAAVTVGSEEASAAQESVFISGERNLMTINEFSDLSSLRRAFEVFEQKTQLMRLMESAAQADGVRIYIGGESGVVPMQDLSVVSAPYEVDGKVVGTLGVIGPTRMPYDRMIQIVDITAKLVGNALSHRD
jgi:heat-inducible transcriptional repressor